MRGEVFIVLCMIAIVIATMVGTICGVSVYNDIKSNIKQKEVITSTVIVTPNCNNTTKLYEIAPCLKDELSTFYKYNLSQKGKELTVEDLKKNGGVCYNYARWYEGRLNSMNLSINVQLVAMKTNLIYNHGVAIASNNDSYCVLDQLNVNCVRFKTNG